MPAQILDGKAVSARILESIKNEVAPFDPKPGLAVVLVGEDPASQVYVKNKEKACAKVGFYSEKIVLPETVSEPELLGVVERLNHNPKIHGILVQFPLPPGLRHLEDKVIRAIDPIKDVDGFHPANVGELATAKGRIAASMTVPCTPKGIMRIMAEYGIDPAGKLAVVLGRSNLVGKPAALLLLAADATVTVCHSKTVDVADALRQADIVIAAIGKPKFVTADMVKTGAVVIDVGINRAPEGLVGDVDFESVKEKTSFITPVPGGIGPMTIAMLMDNVLSAYKSSR